MKKIFKLLIPVFIISIAFSLLFIPAEAAAHESGYAVWDSEQDYLNNPSRPKATSASATLDTNILSGRGYVLCYGNVEVSSQVTMQVGQRLVIDLDGHTLTAKAKIMVNGQSTVSWQSAGSLTIKNGTINHTSGQFIQGRANSEIYLENLVINEQATSGNFITEQSSRIILFKNCSVNISATAKLTFIETSPAYDVTKADLLNNRADYVRNFVFENTVLNDLSEINGESYRVPIVWHKGSKRDILNITFAGTSTFNDIRNNLVTMDNTVSDTQVTVNVGKGIRFATPEVPISAEKFDVNFYDSIVVDGNAVIYGNITELLGAGEEQTPEAPKLIWGRSTSYEYPYQLCTFLVSVTWNVNGAETTEEGYADGVILENEQPTEGFKLTEKGATLETHDGWSLSPEFTDPQKTVTLTAPSTTYYAVFSKNAVSVVEYTDATKTEIVSGVVGNELTSRELDSFRDGSYVCFYENMVWASDESYILNKSLTIDLAGKSFEKNLVLSKDSGNFIVQGGKLTLKNGIVSSSLTSFATVTEGGSVTLDGVTLTFDTSPAFNVRSGAVSLANSVLEQGSTDIDIPAFSLSPEGAVRVAVDSVDMALSGPFAVATAADSVFESAEIDIKNCDSFTADSLITAYEYAADAIPEGASLNMSLDNVLLKSRSVFDVGTRWNGVPAIDIFCFMTDGCYFTAKPEIASGELMFPDGKTVVGFNKEGNEFSYMIATLELPNIMFNLALEEGFTANFYIPKESSLSRAANYLGSYSKDVLSVTAIEGVAYYVIPVSGINPTSILDAIEIELSYISSVDGVEYTAELEYFVTDYFDRLLSDSDPLVKKLAAAAINYVSSAYTYGKCETTDEFEALLSDDRYLDTLRPAEELPAVVSKSDIGNLSVAFTGAQLYLSSDLYLRFNLRESFSGTLALDGNYYTVTDGKVGNVAYIQVKLEAQNFYEEVINVSGSSLDGTAVSGSYSLLDYVNAHATAESSVTEFLTAFYRYCYEANVYQNNGVVPPVNDHTPPLDVELR